MSDQPTSGEWTVEHGNMIYEGETFVDIISDQESRERVVSMHNAALAAERKITFAAQQAALKEGIRSGEFEEQLDAERENSDELTKQIAIGLKRENKLNEQLAAEREKWKSVMGAEPMSIIGQLQDQLATEREAGRREAWAAGDRAIQQEYVIRIEQLREQLAAEERRANDSVEENMCLLNRLAAERDTVGALHKQLSVYNKALAAEREKYVRQREDWIREIQQLQDQLDAERERIKVLESGTGLNAVIETNKQLRKQVESLTEALSEMTERNANFGVRAERDEALKQLDAERARWIEADELLATERQRVVECNYEIETLQEQLASALGKVGK